MKILKLNTPYIINFKPRRKVNTNEVLTVLLRNEFDKNIIATVPNSFIINGSLVVLTLINILPNAKVKDNFEMTIKIGSEIIFYDRIKLLSTNFNVQNYENDRSEFK